MKGIASIAILLCLVLLASGQAAAQQFGTKVQSGDPDVGLPLSTFSPFVGGQFFGFVNYWDIGTTPGVYDDKDVAYLKFGFPNPIVVQANSIRLTGWGIYPAGSYVKPGDSDIGQSPLLPPPALPSAGQASFYYMNVAGGAGYDLGDPVYLKIQSLPGVPPTIPIITGANDIRITTNAGFPAGSRVSLNDPDAAKPLTQFKGLIAAATGAIVNPGTAPIAQLAFYNANGNIQAPPPNQAIYDEGDVVYFDVQPLGFVSPNDVRLY